MRLLGQAAAIGFALAAGLLIQPVRQEAKAAPECRAAELKTTFGVWFNSAVMVSPADAEQIEPGIPNFSVGGMRLLLKVRQPGDGKWKIVFRDADQRLVALLDASEFRDASGRYEKRGLWTGRLEVDLATAQIIGDDPRVRVEVESGVALPSSIDGDARLFSTMGSTPAWENLYGTHDARMSKLGAVVGMLYTVGVTPDQANNGDFQRRPWCCSGVMLSNDLFLTNHHCGSAGGGNEDWTQEQCDATVIDLGWEDRGVRRQLSCRKVVAQDKRLDYAILRVGAVHGGEGALGGSLSAPVARTSAAVGDQVYIIHHAMCEQKLVSRNCTLADRRRAWIDLSTATAPTEYGHNCDTEPGASGAPVFNNDGQLVALHHLGFKQCTGTTLNSAVGIREIAEDVRRRTPTIATELKW